MSLIRALKISEPLKFLSYDSYRSVGNLMFLSMIMARIGNIKQSLSGNFSVSEILMALLVGPLM